MCLCGAGDGTQGLCAESHPQPFVSFILRQSLPRSVRCPSWSSDLRFSGLSLPGRRADWCAPLHAASGFKRGLSPGSVGRQSCVLIRVGPFLVLWASCRSGPHPEQQTWLSVHLARALHTSPLLTLCSCSTESTWRGDSVLQGSHPGVSQPPGSPERTPCPHAWAQGTQKLPHDGSQPQL